MSATSTVVAVRAALKAGLEAHDTVTDDGIQVGDGWQGPDTEAEGIYITDLRMSAQFPTSFGERLRTEVYEQDVVFQAWNAGSTPQDYAVAVARVFTLFGALEDVLANDPNLGPTYDCSIAGAELTTVPIGPSWGSKLVATVAVTSDLT